MRIERVAFPNLAARKKNVCAYARVSVNDDDMLHSLNNQILFYKQEILSHPEWNFVGVFHDKPRTGTKEDRPEFLRMIQLCREGKIDMIITKTISRFARNTITTLKYSRELKSLGVDIYFESENLHTMTSEGELFLTIYAAMAQAESLSVSENCKWRIRRTFQEGEMTPCRILGYDFVDGTLVVNEKEADLVRTIFQRYLDGKGVLAIANELQSEGAKTKGGFVFTRNDVKTILHNEKYRGDLLLQKWFVTDHITKKEVRNKGELDMYYVENHHEPIIDKDTFDKVQTLMQVNHDKFTPKKQPKSYPFTQMLICDSCKAHYRRKTTAAGTKYEKIVWICKTYNSKGKAACSSRQIPEDILIETTARVLNLEQFDEAVFKDRVLNISVLDGYKLIYRFKDGISIETEWQNKSRSESWTEEMKQKAREKRNAYCSNNQGNKNS